LRRACSPGGLQLADTLEAFLDRLANGLDQLTLAEQQRILRLVVREVLIGGDDDTITIRHTIPNPTGPNDPIYLAWEQSSRPCWPIYSSTTRWICGLAGSFRRSRSSVTRMM